MSTDKDGDDCGEMGQERGLGAGWKRTPSFPQPGWHLQQDPAGLQAAREQAPESYRPRWPGEVPPAAPTAAAGRPGGGLCTALSGSKMLPGLSRSSFLKPAGAPATGSCRRVLDSISPGEGQRDGASLAQMSWASGLHSGAAPQISETEGPLKAASSIGGLREHSLAVAPRPRHSMPPGGQIIPQRAPCQSRLFLQPLSALHSISAGFAGISLLGPRVQIKCPFEKSRGDPVPLLLGLRDTRSSPSGPSFWRPLPVPPLGEGPPHPRAHGEEGEAGPAAAAGRCQTPSPAGSPLLVSGLRVPPPAALAPATGPAPECGPSSCTSRHPSPESPETESRVSACTCAFRLRTVCACVRVCARAACMHCIT